MRGRFDSRCLLAILAATVAAALATAGPASAAAPGRCEQIILDVAGEIRPETSGMTCRQIKRMNTGVAPGGAPYLLESPFTGRFWTCRTRGPRRKAPLLRCELGNRHFSIVAAASPKT
jgi:hypothetical protein